MFRGVESFIVPAGGTIGTGDAVDAAGAVATHVVIEPESAMAPAGENDGRDASSGGAGEPAGRALAIAGQPNVAPVTDSAMKLAAAKPNSGTRTRTTETTTAVSMVTNSWFHRYREMK